MESRDGLDQPTSFGDWVPPGHKVRRAYRGEGSVDSGQTDDADAMSRVAVSPKWQAFGEAVLGFHRPVAGTAMCRCGQVLRVCDVRAQAEQYGLIAAACPKEQVAGCACSLCSPTDRSP